MRRFYIRKIRLSYTRWVAWNSTFQIAITYVIQTLTALQFSFGISLGLIKASIITLLMRIFFTRGSRLLVCAVCSLGEWDEG